jgi:hypothetical protein
MAAKKLTDEQFKQAEELWMQGACLKDIAARFGVSIATVKCRLEKAETPRMLIARDRCKPSLVEAKNKDQHRRRVAVRKFFDGLCLGDTVRIQEGACDARHKDRKVQGEVISKNNYNFTLQKRNSRETFDFNYLMIDRVKVKVMKA